MEFRIELTNRTAWDLVVRSASEGAGKLVGPVPDIRAGETLAISGELLYNEAEPGTALWQIGHSAADLAVRWNLNHAAQMYVEAVGPPDVEIRVRRLNWGEGLNTFRVDVIHPEQVKGTTVRVLAMPYSWTAATEAQLLAVEPATSTAMVGDYAQGLASPGWPRDVWVQVLDGNDSWSARRYWDRCGFGFRRLQITVADSAALNRKQLDFHHTTDGRERIVMAYRERAKGLGWDLDSFDRFLACVHPAPSAVGATGAGDVVLDDWLEAHTIALHEMGHLLGLAHPLGMQADGRCTEYKDPWCVMGEDREGSVAIPVPPALGTGASRPSAWRTAKRCSPATLYASWPEFRTSSMVTRASLGTAVMVNHANEVQPGTTVLAVFAAGIGEILVHSRTLGSSIGDDSGLSGAAVVVNSRHLRAETWQDDGERKGIDGASVFEGTLAPLPGTTARFAGFEVRVVGNGFGHVVVTVERQATWNGFTDLAVTRNTLAITCAARDATAVHTTRRFAFPTEWSAWTSTIASASPITSAPAMAVDDSDIYTVADGAIYASYAGGWALVGDRVPRFPASTPVAALRPNLATRHALAVGPGSRLLHTSHGEMQPWQPWRPVAGVTLPARAPIGVAARNATAWFAAAVDTSGFLQIIDWNSGWATPRQISVRQFHPRTQVGVAFGPAGRAHVAAADATGQLFVMSWSPAGGAVSEVAVGAPGIAQQAQIALVPFGANRLQVFACTSTGRVVTADWSPGFPWSTFATLSSPTVRYRCVQAVVGFDGRPEAFALDAGGAVAHFTQSTTGWREQPLLAT